MKTLSDKEFFKVREQLMKKDCGEAMHDISIKLIITIQNTGFSQDEAFHIIEMMRLIVQKTKEQNEIEEKRLEEETLDNCIETYSFEDFKSDISYKSEQLI